ncbi:unnamed protein product [Brassica oleracea]|uniref:Uncharacterized protein n=1 Tax=Brassica oleracea TaxID=3712 RepID=A0A3P6C2D0_BRAOL|nr:unnamed protein product [Brassica oleracea]
MDLNLEEIKTKKKLTFIGLDLGHPLPSLYFFTNCLKQSFDTELMFQQQNLSSLIRYWQSSMEVSCNIKNPQLRSMDDLKECGDFVVFWSLLSAELHRRVRCLAMDRHFSTVRLSSYFDTG